MADREGDIETLAVVLYETLERLDPGLEPFKEWAELTEHDRGLYRHCIRAITAYRDPLQRLANYDVIAEGFEAREQPN